MLDDAPYSKPMRLPVGEMVTGSVADLGDRTHPAIVANFLCFDDLDGRSVASEGAWSLEATDEHGWDARNSHSVHAIGGSIASANRCTADDLRVC